MGHSLGEYGALVAAGALSFDAALEAVSARGREMTHVSHGRQRRDGRGLRPAGRDRADRRRGRRLRRRRQHQQPTARPSSAARPPPSRRPSRRSRPPGITAMRIPVSHAFHTAIVAPASEPLKVAMRRLEVRGAEPADRRQRDRRVLPGRRRRRDDARDPRPPGRRRRCSSSRACDTLYEAGARVFVEVGPKKALHGFVEDVLGSEHDDVLALFTNHPKLGDVASFNQALCGLYAAGLGFGPAPGADRRGRGRAVAAAPRRRRAVATAPSPHPPPHPPPRPRGSAMSTARYAELGRLFAGVLEQGLRVYSGEPGAAGAPAAVRGPTQVSTHRSSSPAPRSACPACERVFDDENVAAHPRRPAVHRRRSRTASASAMVDKHITRLVKSEPGGPGVRDDRRRGRRHQAGRARRAPRPRRRSSASTPPATRRSTRTTRLAIGAGLRRPARRRHPAGHALPDDDPGHAAARDAGGCPRRCATTPASSSPRPSPGYDVVRRRHRAATTTDRGRREQLAGARGRPRPDDRRRAGRGRGRPPHRRAAAPARGRAASSSTAASSSAACRWATRSSPSSSAPAARTPRSTRPARAPPRPCRSPRTGSAPAAAAAWSSSPPTTSPRDALLPWIGVGLPGLRRRRHRRRRGGRGDCRSTVAATG